MVSVVIVNWNSGSFLENCVLSLLENAGGCPIIIVDNASTDNSLNFAAGKEAGVTVLCNNENIGFAAACNRGWRAAGSESEHILFLNPDTQCFPGSVHCLEETLSTDKTIWAVGGCLISPDGREQTGFNVRTFPTIGSVAAEMFFIDEICSCFRMDRPRKTALTPDPVDVEQPAAACLMTTRTVLESLGGFDDTFHPAWFEDVDLCKRIHDGGGRILYQPRGRFLHHGGYSLDRIHRQDFLQYFHTNQIRYFRKHHGIPAALKVKKLIVMGFLLRTAVSLVYPLIQNTSRTKSAVIFRDALRNIVNSSEVHA